MGKLFDSIKKPYQELVQYQNDQEKDYVAETTYDKLYNNNLKVRYLNFFINEVSNNKNYYFGSNENFKAFLEENKSIFPGTSIQIASFAKSSGTIDVKGVDYENILNTIEAKIGEKKVNELIEKYSKYTPSMPEPLHPFSQLTKEITFGLDELNLTEQKIAEYTEALAYASEELIVKKEGSSVDDIIDAVSMSRQANAKKIVKDYAEEIGADAESVDKLKSSTNSVVFQPDETDEKIALAPFLSHQPKYSEEFKNKVLELDKLIEEKGLIPNGAPGETGNKEYGFMDYFAKALELKQALLDYGKVVDSNDKIKALENISLKTQELKDVTSKYNDVLGYIKENFDLSKISLNGNIYSGRVHSSDKLENYFPNFPKRWDFENAGYSAVLNGFAQLKGAAKQAGVSIEEYLENPTKSFLKGAKKAIEKADEKYIIPRKDENGNDIALGKRLAHATVMDLEYPQILEAYKKSNRGMEFLNHVSEVDDNTYKNIVSSAAGSGLIFTYDHCAYTLFSDHNKNDYDSLQNLFALGNDTDNLLALSKNYFHDNAAKPDLKEPYDIKIKVKKDVNPLNETRRVMAVLKDYMVERNRMYLERYAETNTHKLMLEDQVEPATLFVAAKKYMNDFIYKNNIDLLALDKKQRNEVFSFLNDPVKAFEEKYEDEPNFFKTDINGRLEEDFDSISKSFKEEFDDLYKSTGDKFVAAFEDLNNQTKGRNAGKSIVEILNANKGGYFERKFGTTSRVYKALETSVLAATDPKSSTYGDLTGAKVYAQKYIDHKLPQGANFEKLSESEKRRVEFCHTIIGATLQMELNRKMEESNIKLAPDNAAFQEKVKVDVDLDLDKNNNNIEIENSIVNENIKTQ